MAPDIDAADLFETQYTHGVTDEVGPPQPGRGPCRRRPSPCTVR